MSDVPQDGAAESRWNALISGSGNRSAYKNVWNVQAADTETAKLAVAGYVDERQFESSALDTLAVLNRTVGIGPQDIVLEIGCGVGRVGIPVSQRCLHWIGTDISGRMIAHAKERLRDRPNVTLIELSEVGLSELPSNTIDVVYCTVVFMHLYEWDRYKYVQEAFRVLRPGGRCYFDNVDITSELGWRVFQAGASYPPDQRPAHLSMVSTADELRTYAVRAGFESVRVQPVLNGWLALTATKPAGGFQ